MTKQNEVRRSSAEELRARIEDMLCELLDKVDDDRAGQAEIIAEYAAKLRLAADVKDLRTEFPRRRAMLSIYGLPKCYSWQDITIARLSKREEVARVPVFVWPTPTVDGDFIVEHQNGRCQKVRPDSLTFLGSKELFDQYDWTEHE